jgi:hypothetical protein
MVGAFMDPHEPTAAKANVVSTHAHGSHRGAALLEEMDACDVGADVGMAVLN